MYSTSNSVYSLLDDMFRNIDTIYYCNVQNTPRSCDELLDLMLHEDKCRQFINDYFSMGSKESLQIDLSSVKASHTVSIYFLGILIAINTGLDKKIIDWFQLENPANGNYQFLYYWFLCSLYHDHAFYLEDAKQHKLDFQALTEITNSSTYFLGKEFRYTNYPGLYPKDTYLRYFLFSLIKRNVHEHGLIGGLMFYRRAKDNLINNYVVANQNEPLVKTKDFISNQLHWSLNHIDIFRRIAFSIMDHNIWKQDDRSVISDFGLQLIEKGNDRLISPRGNPLGFLLSIVDCIDPYKLFLRINVKHLKVSLEKLLTNTYIDFFVDYMNMYTEISEARPEIENHYSNIGKLSDWLDIVSQSPKTSINSATLAWDDSVLYKLR